MVADRQATLTLQQCAAAFISVKEKEWKNAKHGEQWRTTLVTYADPDCAVLVAIGITATGHRRVLSVSVAL